VTFLQGLLSGLGHPIIGPDHLAFVLAVGLIAAFFTRGYALALVFVGATLVGCLVHLAALDLPAVGPLVSASVIAAGALLALRRSIGQRGFAGLVGIAGVFHGYAYGESIVGAEPTPLAAYLIGFAVVQSAIALGTFAGARLLLAKAGPLAIPALRTAGGAIALAGAVFFVSSVSA